MKVAVVGGAGFVGSHVVDALVEVGHEVVVIDNFFLGKMSNLSEAQKIGIVKVYTEDARQLTVMEEIIKKEKTPVVVNLAMKCLPTSFVDPEGAYMAGVKIVHNLAYMLRQRKYKRLIHFSSSEVYGTAQCIPMSENHPTNPTTPYGAGKLSADHLLLSYHSLYGDDFDVTILRPFNLIGPRQNWNLYAAVVPITIARILKGEKPVVEWDGMQTRDFTYVRDVADVVPTILCDSDTGPIHLASGQEVTIRKLIEEICCNLHYPLSEIATAPKRVGDVRRHCADISLARLLLNYQPKTSLKEAVAKTIDWFQAHLLV